MLHLPAALSARQGCSSLLLLLQPPRPQLLLLLHPLWAWLQQQQGWRAWVALQETRTQTPLVLLLLLLLQ
jgi:hypothetical protein